MNQQVSRQKAEYVSHNPNLVRGDSAYVELVYKRLDGENPGQVCTTGAFVSQLDEDSKKLIKAGGQFVVVKTKTDKFWNLTKVENISTWVDKPAYTGGGQKSYGKGGQASTYNTAGIKVGAVLHDAVALYATGKISSGEAGAPFTTDIRAIAEKLLELSYELEMNVETGKYKPKETKTICKESVAVESQSDGLESVDW